MKKYVIELIGTFFLVLVIGLTGNPLAIGSVLMVMIYMGGHVSGAHYNPAVTIAVLMQKKIDTKDAGMYIVFQVLGSIAAAVVAYIITGNTFAPSPNPNASRFTPTIPVIAPPNGSKADGLLCVSAL